MTTTDATSIPPPLAGTAESGPGERSGVLDLAGPLPSGRTLLEASAGTGKTYSLTAWLVRALVERDLTPDQVLVVTFTRAATAELRARTRAQLQDALLALDDPARAPAGWLAGLADVDPPERDRRRAAVRDALANLDAATVTTIHGFCQQALRQIGVRAARDGDGQVVASSDELRADVVRDLLVRELHDDPFALSPAGAKGKRPDPGAVEKRLLDVVRALATNQGSRPAPGPDAAVEPPVARRWAELAEEALDTMVEQRAATGVVAFDDLVLGLHDACTDPVTGDDVCRSLRARYRLVLVDEFQDTDPLQWRIFSRAFTDDPGSLGPASDLVVVGDPKQAIYRFRGADVGAYLDAVGDGSIERRELVVNHRSDTEVLRGLNALLRGATFGDDRIRYTEVEPRPDAPDHALVRRGRPDEGFGAAVQLRWVPRHDGLTGAKATSVDPTRGRALVRADLVNHVVELLEQAELCLDGTARPVRPGDIAVVVPTNDSADAVVDDLRARGVPAVRSRTNSVLQTDAVGQWRVLLRAAADPADAGRVRALALSWFCGHRPAELEGDDGDRLVEGLQRQVAEWAGWLATEGVHGFFARLRALDGVLAAVVGSGAGERGLTDLEHLAELLHVETAGEPIGARAVLGLLDRLVVSADPEAEATKRRIDSDAAAVQVTTVHGAKGLEYPVVLVPFSARSISARPTRVYDRDGCRWVDAAPGIDWTGDELGPAGRKAAEQAQTIGDDLRLLYVALTRARHHLVVWWLPIFGAERCALGRVLFGERTDGAVDTATAPKLGDDGWCADRLAALRPADGSISVVALPESVEPVFPTPALPVPGPRPEAARLPRPVADGAWRRWSFTSMAPPTDIAVEGVAPVRGGVDEPLVGPRTELGGLDEPGVGGDLVGLTPTTDSAADADSPFGRLPAGAEFGVVVHAVLEELDTADADLVGALRATVDEVLARHGAGPELDPDALVAAVLAALRTPLDPLAPGVALADLAPVDRLAELRFDLRLRDGRTGLDAAAIGRAVVDHASVGDPFAGYFADLAERFGRRRLAGYLHGSIDAVLRLPGPDGPCFAVVDYKTNRLAPGPVAEAYGTAALVEAMAHHHYPLQALLYSVAVHRYLRWRLPDYDCDQHLVGAGYLFLRGMVGPDAPLVDGARPGVLTWSPGAAVIEAVDDLLAGGS